MTNQQAPEVPKVRSANYEAGWKDGYKQEARRLTPLQAQVAAHYQGGEFDYIEAQHDAKDVGDGLFTFCINEAGDAGDKSELVNMLNRAIEQLRSLVSELEAVDGRVGEGVAA